MNKINRNYIVEYLNDLLPERKRLEYMEKYAEENHVPIIQPEVTQFLKVLLKLKTPKNILEIGTAIGYSAIVMAENTPEETKIDTIERRQDMLELANENINKFQYSDKINTIYGEAGEILANLNKKYDFIFLDAAKGHYKEFFNECMRLIELGGIIICDNVLFKGMIATDDLVVKRKKTIVKRLRMFLRDISDIEGYTTSIIPIGDGIALVYREE